MDLERDPRFRRGAELFDEGAYFEAADCFEELFFEAVRDEVPVARFFMQLAVGAYHADCGQPRPAAERLGEALVVAEEAGRVASEFDVGAIAGSIRANLALLRDGARSVRWPPLARK